MLKVTTKDLKQTLTLKLEGRLAGPWVQEVTRVWADTACQQRQYVVDLTAVTFIDNPGRALLEAMSQRGAHFIAADCLTRDIVAEIEKRNFAPTGPTIFNDRPLNISYH